MFDVLIDNMQNRVDIEFSVNSDSFLHSSPTTLLAYRRNYFVLRFNLTTPALTPSGLYLSSDQPISRFIARIQAHSDMPLDDNSSEKKIVRDIVFFFNLFLFVLDLTRNDSD